jgi:hypothetical protein
MEDPEREVRGSALASVPAQALSLSQLVTKVSLSPG